MTDKAKSHHADGDGKRLTLHAGEAHVWYCWTHRCDQPDIRAHYRSLLNFDECARLDRFAFDCSRLEYLVTRALCRYTLSRYADVAPSQWHFETNRYGRPEIAPAIAPAGLRFNLSNTRSLVACVVARDAELGIDVETLDRSNDVAAIADQYFSQSELDDLRSLPATEQKDRFYQLWTLKESYIKARGMGLTIPLAQFSFRPQELPIRISFGPELDDAPESWQFEQYRPDDRHLMAVAVGRPCGKAFLIRLHETLPHETGRIDGLRSADSFAIRCT